MQALPSIFLGALLAAAALPALAGTDIDLVYSDDLPARGDVTAEMAGRWSQTPRGGSFGGRPLWQAVGELAVGVTDNVSVGVKIPVTRVDGRWHGNGAYAEVTYVAPHRSDGMYWGVEAEAGSIRPAREERAWVLEAFPIIGYRAGHWHVTGNPGVEYTSDDKEKGWGFSPKAKVAYQLNDALAVGLEYHVDAGKFGHFTPRRQRTETAYLTWDAHIAGKRMSLALGHGATKASDRWVLRIGMELDD